MQLIASSLRLKGSTLIATINSEKYYLKLGYFPRVLPESKYHHRPIFCKISRERWAEPPQQTFRSGGGLLEGRGISAKRLRRWGSIHNKLRRK